MRALISVFDKDGIIEFAKKLSSLKVEIVSSGGTHKLLKENGVPVISVEDVTGFAECLGGRVKTMHPNIHAGILANRSIKSDMQTIDNLDIAAIDIVVVNLYPFSKVISSPEHSLEEAIENIDIGGPTLIRAAAKNYSSVSVITDSADYKDFLLKLENNTINEEYRFSLAQKAFNHTANYDLTISNYLNGTWQGGNYPESINLTLTKKQVLRYGENPHQSAAYYVNSNNVYNGVENAIVLHGKELSYNNINDTQGAISLAMEFEEPVCVAVKHATPCGVAIANTIEKAFEKAYNCDSVSIFGGIICLNREVDLETAKMMSEIFLEVIVAPSYSSEAFALLSKKKNVRILTLAALNSPAVLQNDEFKSVGGGFLVQKADTLSTAKEDKTVTNKKASPMQKLDMDFGMKVVKHVKSNAIVVVKDGQTLGIGGGEVSRIWAANAALERAGEKAKGAVVASDAFFPFPDVVEACANSEIAAIVQPGGSKNDQLSIDECDKQNIAMVFTGVRHFKH